MWAHYIRNYEFFTWLVTVKLKFATVTIKLHSSPYFLTLNYSTVIRVGSLEKLVTT